MSSKRNEKDTLVQINKTTDDPIEGKTKDVNEKKNQHPSTSKEKPSIEVLKQIFQEIDINNDETLQKSEIKRAAMIDLYCFQNQYPGWFDSHREVPSLLLLYDVDQFVVFVVVLLLLFIYILFGYNKLIIIY